MATAQTQVSPEILEQISTESFAQNISNYRSLLLRFQKEIKDGKALGEKAGLINREIVGMNRIVGEQIDQAGTNARKLGVPPDALQEVARIYTETIRLWSDQLISQYSYLFGDQVTKLIELAQNTPDLPEQQRELVRVLVECQLNLREIAAEPATAHITLVPFLAKAAKVGQLWETITEWQAQPDQIASTAGGPPNVPPATAGNSGDNDPMDARIKALEVDMRDVRDRLARVETKIDSLASKEDLQTAVGKLLGELNGQTWKFIGVVTTVGALLTAAVYYIARHVPAV